MTQTGNHGRVALCCDCRSASRRRGRHVVRLRSRGGLALTAQASAAPCGGGRSSQGGAPRQGRRHQDLDLGNGADSTFGGLDKLLSRDWSAEAFIKRYTFVDPRGLLCEPGDSDLAFAPWRARDEFDTAGFLKVVHGEGVTQAFMNAIGASGCEMRTPYEDWCWACRSTLPGSARERANTSCATCSAGFTALSSRRKRSRSRGPWTTGCRMAGTTAAGVSRRSGRRCVHRRAALADLEPGSVSVRRGAAAWLA